MAERRIPNAQPHDSVVPSGPEILKLEAEWFPLIYIVTGIGNYAFVNSGILDLLLFDCQ
jgi:hypothetical protein